MLLAQGRSWQRFRAFFCYDTYNISRMQKNKDSKTDYVGDKMFLISIAAFAVVMGWLKGDWRNWQRYQATILFFILSDLVHNFLIYNNLLWEYTTPYFNHVQASLLVSLIVYPATVLIFVPGYPQRNWQRAIYVLKWVAIYALPEYAAVHLGYLNYHHGWNFGYSVLFLLIAFPTLILHYHKPLQAYAVGVVLAVLMLWYFRLPVGA